MTYEAAWLRAFLLTQVVEVPLATWLLRDGEISLPRRAGMVFFASLVTHPAVWFLFPHLPLSYEKEIACAELFAWIVEAIYYALVFPQNGLRRAVGVSALANGASFGTGLLLYALHLL